jgi:hypothetical protein
MITSIIQKAKGFILDPVEAFRQSKDDEPGRVVTYFALLLLFNAVLATIIAALKIELMPVFTGMPWARGLPFALFFMMLIGGFLLSLIFGVWLHLWVYLFGGRKGIMQTLKVVMYGSTPRLLFGWIPFIGFLFLLWSLALGILGIRELQEMDTLKAILVVALAVMIPVILLIILAVYLFTMLVTTNGMPPVPMNIE